MYAVGKRRDIQILLAAGVPQEQIAKLTGVSVRTIRRIGREPARPGLAVTNPTAAKPAGRPQRTGSGLLDLVGSVATGNGCLPPIET